MVAPVASTSIGLGRAGEYLEKLASCRAALAASQLRMAEPDRPDNLPDRLGGHPLIGAVVREDGPSNSTGPRTGGSR